MPPLSGGCSRPDRAHHEAGRADALKEHVAREIVGARPQRRERRQQPRLQLDEAADIGRGALLHRQPHALELVEQPRRIHLRHAQHEAVGALADVAGLDKARQRHRIERPRQHGVREARGPQGRHGKARRDRRDHDSRDKEAASPQQEGGDAEATAAATLTTEQRLVRGGEIERDAGAKGDGHPRQQPACAGLGAHPGAQPFEQGRPGRAPATAPACRALRGSARRPGPGNALAAPGGGAAPRPALPCGQHPTTPGHQATGSCGMRTSRTEA